TRGAGGLPRAAGDERAVDVDLLRLATRRPRAGRHPAPARDDRPDGRAILAHPPARRCPAAAIRGLGRVRVGAHVRDLAAEPDAAGVSSIVGPVVYCLLVDL